MRRCTNHSGFLRFFLPAFLLVLFLTNQIKAQIPSINSIVEPPVYVSGGTNEVVFHIWFGVFNPEYADFIEFIAPPGVTLSSNFTEAEEYYECGKNHGELMAANFGANGIGWGRPGFSLGGSTCGAFQDSTWHTFKIKIEATSAVTGSIVITTNVYGDGSGLPSPSFASTTIGIINSNCLLNCPDDITVYTDPGECETWVDFYATGTSTAPCNIGIIDFSDFYPVGTTTVEFIANEGTLNEVRCTRHITVIDNTPPELTACEDTEVQLGGTECSGIVDFDFGINENCGSMTHSLVQSKINDIDFSIGCQLGPNSYYRVFDLASEDVLNDLEIDRVELGVYESLNSPPVDVRIYALNGPLMPVNMSLLYSQTVILPNLNQALYDIPVNLTIEGGSTFVLEITTPANDIGFGSIMGFNNVSELGTSYIRSAACNELYPVPVASAFGGAVSGSLVLNVHGEEAAIKVRPNHASALMPGDEFGIGIHQLSYTISDASGNESICNFDLTVNGASDGNGVLACNDTVRVSMEGSCQTLITPDMVLEGDHYGCYEFYEVIVYDPQGNPLGSIVGPEWVGYALQVDVYHALSDNRCSGVLLIEDFYPPVFECDTVTTTCAGNTLPGSPLPTQLAYNISPEDNVLPADQSYLKEFHIPVNGLNTGVIIDLDVTLDITHSSVSDLTAILSAPDGTNITLFLKPGGGVNCQGDDLLITLDDAAANGPAMLDLMCEPEPPAISGRFRPVNPLSILNGTSLNGDWVLTILDDTSVDGGILNQITLAFHQASGTLQLPIPEWSTFVQEGTNHFTAYDFDACGPVKLTYEDDLVPGDCDSPFSGIIYRNWIAEDPSGNKSYCTQVIQLLNNGIAFLVFPPDYDDDEAESFDCIPGDDFYPHPDLTGYPSGDLCEDIQMIYNDQRIDICPGTFKILRYWKVTDWCSGTVIEDIQVIRVKDDEGPIVTTGVPDVTLYTDPLYCSTDVDLPDPFGDPSMILYDCREEEITYTVAYKLAGPNGGAPPADSPWISDERIQLIQDGNGKYHYRLHDVPADSTWIRYRLTDPCGNYTDAFFEIVVVDNAPPVAICDEHTQVALGTAGTAPVPAINFDDGSHDNCSEVTFQARRMTPGCDSITVFRDSVLFCCSDVGTVQMVELKVTDANGNFSICMVEVEVVDKYPPLLICPDDIVIDCRADYLDTDLTGVAEAYDNCGIDTLYFADNVQIDNCGSGTVIRTWYARDVTGYTSSCYQRITLEDNEPFQEQNIHWPKDITLYECESNTGPEITGFVETDDDLCSMVAVTYKDQVFNVVEDACIKILRKWSVVDWCTFDDQHPYSSGYWTHTQVIKLMNSEAPEFTDQCRDLEFCSYGKCEGYIEFVKEAHDDCTPDELLRWIHHVDLFNDGVFDYYDVHSNDASRTYPDGTHRIAWIVEDRCGNRNTCEQLFEVKDCKKPTPVCISQLATVVMNNNGMVTICAEDFDLCGNCGIGSYDNCTEPENLLFSFSANVSDTCRTLTCNDIPNGESAFIELEMWVTDEAGNQEYCNVTLDLQDNEGNVCLDTLPGAIVVSGRIRNPENQALPGVEILLEDELSNIGFPRFEYTGTQGSYAFDQLYENRDYLVTPSDNNDPAEGVSTLDLIFIQRHLLGLEALSTPFQIIAADADNNQKITAADLLVIRKLVLGVNDEFPNGQSSWRFVSDWHEFLNPDDPFPFLESIHTTDFKNLIDQVNFTGVKIGDINNSSALTTAPDLENRSEEALVMTVENQTFRSGEPLVLTFGTDNLDRIAGSQFTLQFDSDVLKFNEFEGQKAFVGNNNAGLRYADQGLITISWNTDVSFDNGNEALFDIHFTAISDGQASEVIRLTDLITPGEAYTADDEIVPVSLRFSDGDTFENSRTYSLHQNMPNPFSDKTEIYFELAEEADAVISFYDLTGKQIGRIQDRYEAGLNRLEVSKSGLQARGVIYYKLETGSFTQTRKMICID